jgi:hypothetical protein
MIRSQHFQGHIALELGVACARAGSVVLAHPADSSSSPTHASDIHTRVAVQCSGSCIVFVRKIRLSFFRTTRFHHIIAPVTNMPAGASPKTAQINFVVESQSPGPLQGIPIPCLYASRRANR